MVFFIDEACSRPPPALLTNVNKKMVFLLKASLIIALISINALCHGHFDVVGQPFKI